MIKGTEKGKCFLCGREVNTEVHHIFEGATRTQCDKDGLTVNLCHECHLGTYGAHGYKGNEVRRYLHQTAQKELEDRLVDEGMTMDEARAEFIKRYIKSYIW